MEIKILFLDIDGVLNGHEFCREAQSALIDKKCIKRLNKILKATGAKIILCSAWRYMILIGEMKLKGFEYMLRTHGMIATDIIDLTVSDEVKLTRKEQVQECLNRHPEISSWVMLDDLKGVCPDESRFVRTNSETGLTDEDVEKAIGILNGSYILPKM